ncbi:hypothetical protein AeRB84_000766 [Aphanomyces euteiches]|nr:hypothetical protein AeRB84_000766 [Aphanomyces euteiches]
MVRKKHSRKSNVTNFLTMQERNKTLESLDFATYNADAIRWLQNYYTPELLAEQGRLYSDRANGTTVLHWPIHRNVSELTTFPGAFFYGFGIRQALMQFLEAKENETFGRCQHVLFLSSRLGEFCVWINPPTETDTSDEIQVFQALVNWQQSSFLWIKLAVRIVLTAYVCRELAVYYNNYNILATNFIKVGLSNKSIVKIQIYVGDPTCVILSNVWVSLVFVLDFWFSIDSVGEALLAISQVHDLPAFLLAILYCSRSVWFAYFSMRASIIVIKRFHLEHYFQPIDPTMVAIAAVVYTATLMILSTTTPLMHVEYLLWDVTLSEAAQLEAIDTFPITTGITLALGAIPIIFSVGAKLYHSRSKRQVQRGPSAKLFAQPSRRTSLVIYNDLKQRMAFKILGLGRLFNDTDSVGGSLYKLHERNPAYNLMPLFSYRGSDCFVACYMSNGQVDSRMRLTLWRCLDCMEKNQDQAIHVCKTEHDNCLSRLDATPCATFFPRHPSALCIHIGKDKSPWIL